MKEEINVEEIWQSVLHSYDMYIDYDVRGHSAIITAMKILANKVLDLAAENAEINWIENSIEMESDSDFSFRDSNGNWCEISIKEDSILQIKDWIK